MSASRTHREFTVNDMRLLRAEIEDQLALISRQPYLQKSQVLALAHEHGANNLTSDKFDYMVRNRLIVPQVVQGDGRDTHLYGRDQVREVILVDRLRQTGKLNYTQIANLFRDDQATFQETARLIQPSGKDDDSNDPTKKWRGLFPTQRWRGLLILRSRIVGILLNWIVNQKILVNIVVHARERQGHGAGLPRGVVQIKHSWLGRKEADTQVGELRENDLLGYVTNDGEVLFPRFPHKNLLPFGHPCWFHLSVEFGKPLRHYELTIGLPDESFRESVPNSTGAR